MQLHTEVIFCHKVAFMPVNKVEEIKKEVTPLPYNCDISA
jgi:hypothetical protein